MSKEKDTPKPNVAFVGNHADGSPKEVPAFINTARLTIKIGSIKHGEGFYSEHAARLIGSGSDFKAFVSKGEK